MSYQGLYQQSIEQSKVFWRKQAELIKLYEFPETILSQDENGFFRWFAGGKLNTSYLSLDAHIVDQLNEAKPTLLPLEPFASIGRTAYLIWKEWRADLEK